MLDVGWKAALDLSFVHDGARTALQDRRHVGPLRVQRPFYPEGAHVCHVYLLHPPGGLVAGDQLSIAARIESGAHALLTTPAAGKLYRSRAPELFSLQEQHLQVEPAARLEWLPQETIAFRGARAQLRTRVELRGDARFVGWEILCLGRRAAGEAFDAGCLRPRFEVTRDERLVYIERGWYDAGTPVMHAPWGLCGQPVVATLLCAAPGVSRHIEGARAALLGLADAADGGRVAVSAWDDCLVARYLGPSAERARESFAALWGALRPEIFGCSAVHPRIWRT